MLQKFFIAVVCLFVFSGCSAPQDQTLTTQLQLRVGGLERELDLKENQIVDMQSKMNVLVYEVDRMNAKAKKQELARLEEKKKEEAKKVEPRRMKIQPAAQVAMKKRSGIIRIPVSTSRIQVALQNAGYYEGSIDNKIGNKTKRAISQFQKDNGLKADGIVGEKTWDQLKGYIE